MTDRPVGSGQLPPGHRRLRRKTAAIAGGAIFLAVLLAYPYVEIARHARTIPPDGWAVIGPFLVFWTFVLVPRCFPRWEAWFGGNGSVRVVRTFLGIPLTWRTLTPRTTTGIRDVTTSQKRDVMLEISPPGPWPPRLFVPVLSRRDASFGGIEPEGLRLLADGLDSAGTVDGADTAARLRAQAEHLEATGDWASSPLAGTTTRATLFRERPDEETPAAHG